MQEIKGNTNNHNEVFTIKSHLVRSNFEEFKIPDSQQMDIIINIISEKLNIAIDFIKSKRRCREAVFPRQLIIFFTWRFTNLGHEYISFNLGQRHHSTSIHNLESIENDIECSVKILNKVKETGSVIFGEKFEELFERYLLQKKSENNSDDVKKKILINK